jgi:cytochrome c biogenesis protein CcdA
LIGLYSLLGRRPLPIPGLGRRGFGQPVSGGVAFGAAYAVASLSCTLPIFHAVVGGRLLSEGIGASLVPFLGYAAGMGGVLLPVTLATALSAGAVVRVLRRAMPSSAIREGARRSWWARRVCVGSVVPASGRLSVGIHTLEARSSA